MKEAFIGLLILSLGLVVLTAAQCAGLRRKFAEVREDQAGNVKHKLFRRTLMKAPPPEGQPFPFPCEERLLVTSYRGVPIAAARIEVALPARTAEAIEKVSAKETDSLFPAKFRSLQ